MQHTKDLSPEDIRAARAEHSKLRDRDLADKLDLSEAQLVAAFVGHGVTPIVPHPDQVIDYVLPHLKPGDLLAHCYSCRPDGLMGDRPTPSPALTQAIANGVRLDLGHGINFSFAIARRLIALGLFPYTISSDVHGDFTQPHNDATLDYSLCGALSKLMALGMDLTAAIAAVTLHPARVLQAETEIGTLQIGSRADITVLETSAAPWLCRDAQGEQLIAPQKLSPAWGVKSGQLLQPHRRLLRDLATAS